MRVDKEKIPLTLTNPAVPNPRDCRGRKDRAPAHRRCLASGAQASGHMARASPCPYGGQALRRAWPGLSELSRLESSHL